MDSIKAGPAAAKSIKVFLGDDSAAIRKRIACMLSSHATVVGEGETTNECIKGILATHPDVVVLDVQLMGGKGLEVLLAVRAVDPHVAFVIFSNNSLPIYRKRYIEAGAKQFLDKSTEFHRLAAAVEAAARTGS